MGQIDKGHEFNNGDLVTFENLNQLVDLATLNNGAIALQTPIDSVSDSDLLLVSSGGDLKKATVAQLSAGLDLNQFLKADGSVVMEADAQLQLGSSAPVNDLHAVSKGKLDATLLNYLQNSGFQIFTGAFGVQGGGILLATGNSLFLGKDPASALEAATKQYVDSASNIKSKASFSGVLGNADTVACSYARNSGNNLITITSTINPHGLSDGHKLFLNRTSITTGVGLVSAIYQVTVVDDYVFTVTGSATTATTGLCNFVKCLIYPGSTGVSSITFAGATNDGSYFLNFTNNFADTNYAPVFSLSQYNESTNLLVNGGIALLDRIISTASLRSVNCLPFSAWANAFGPCGTRSSVIVF